MCIFVLYRILVHKKISDYTKTNSFGKKTRGKKIQDPFLEDLVFLSLSVLFITCCLRFGACCSVSSSPSAVLITPIF